MSTFVLVAPELQSSKETLPVVPPVFSNDQQTQLGVGVVDGVTSGVGETGAGADVP
jgi:hypothetical protein